MLFDLRRDPHERHNVAGAHADLAALYHHRVMTYRMQGEHILDNYATLQLEDRCQGSWSGDRIGAREGGTAPSTDVLDQRSSHVVERLPEHGRVLDE